MEKVSKKGKQRRSAPTAASTGTDPSAAVLSANDPSAASTVHVESNVSPQSSSGESREESRGPSPPPPPPSTTLPPVAPVQQQQQQHQQQHEHLQQQQHQHQQGIKVSKAGRRQLHAPSVAFDEKLNQLWAAVFNPPESSGGLDPAHGEMEYASEYSDGTEYPEYSDPNGIIPQSQEHPVHPKAQDDPRLLPSTSARNRAPFPLREDVIGHQGENHPGATAGEADLRRALGSHARDMGPPRTSRACGSRAIPPRSAAFNR